MLAVTVLQNKKYKFIRGKIQDINHNKMTNNTEQNKVWSTSSDGLCHCWPASSESQSPLSGGSGLASIYTTLHYV